MKYIAAFMFVLSLSAPALAQDQQQDDQPQAQEAQQPAQDAASVTDDAANQTAEQPADDTPEDQKDLATQVEDARLALSLAIKEQDSQAGENPAGSAVDQQSRAAFSAQRLAQAAKVRELSIRFHELSQKLIAQQAAQAGQQ